MLLLCPNCSARYLVSSIALGEVGRGVRCAKCDHEWFEKPDDVPFREEVTETEGESSDSDEEGQEDVYDFVDVEEETGTPLVDEPIPESVKPRDDKINVPALADDALRTSASLQAKVTGYFSALAIFGILFGMAVLLKQPIVSLWPPASAIYSLAGLTVSYKGEDLVMESLTAQIQKDAEGKDYLTLQGRVINLTNNVQEVPKLFARLRSTNGEDGKGWSIDSPLEKLAPGESFTFKSDYPVVPRGVGSVNLTFVPTVSL